MKSKFFPILAAVIAIFSIFTAYRYYNEDATKHEEMVKLSDDKYLHLEQGITRYQVYGNDSDPTIILIHGFNAFIESWNPNIESLVDAGYRVIAYDLWGRGLSTKPRGELNLKVFRKQLDSLLNHLGVEKVSLLGSSFGCVVASDYALNNSGRVAKLALVGPAGWPSAGNSSNELINLPVLGDVVFHYFGEKILRPKVEAYLYNKNDYSWVVEKWNEFAALPGFTRASLSILRHSPVLDYSEGWAKLGNLGKPTLFIWGKQDVSFPFANAEKAATLIPHAKIVGIDEAAHWVNIEKAPEVNSELVSFLAQ